jgi:hypothetical protein
MMPSLLPYFFDPGLLPHGQGPEPSGDAVARIRAIRGDPKHAYNVPTSPAHDEAVREMNSLYERLSLPEAGLRDELDVAL